MYKAILQNRPLSLVLRYSAVRRQFGPTEGGPEVPVLEYQLQQWRLLPYLAATYVMQHFAKTFFMNFVELRIGLMMKDNSARQVRGALSYVDEYTIY